MAKYNWWVRLARHLYTFSLGRMPGREKLSLKVIRTHLYFWHSGYSSCRLCSLRACYCGIWFFSDILTVEVFHSILSKAVSAFKKIISCPQGVGLQMTSSAPHSQQCFTLWVRHCPHREMSNRHRRKEQSKAWFVFTQVLLIHEPCKSPQGNISCIFLISL